MGSIFSYAVASSILLSIGYLAYKWIMAGERQHSCNRLVLYLIYIFAFTLPALAGEWRSLFPPVSSTEFNAAIEIGALQTGIISQEPLKSGSRSIVPVVMTIIYSAGVFAALIYSLAGAWQIASIIRNGEKQKKGRYTLVISDRNDIAPFSWLNFYVMNRNDYATAGEIISTHERRHLKLLHWADLAVVQLVNIFQWFNPAAWLMGEEFKTVHEYQADEAVLASGTNLRQYQTLLIKKAVGTRFQVLANSLNHSKLKKRITMMYKSNSPKSRRLGALVLIPAMAIGCAVIEIPAVAAALDKTSDVAFAGDIDSKVTNFYPDSNTETAEFTDTPEIVQEQQQFDADTDMAPTENNPAEATTALADTEAAATQASPAEQAPMTSPADTDKTAVAGSATTDKKKEEVYVAVEQPAEYPGGLSELMKWLNWNIKYPEKALKDSIQGRVIVKFVVEKDGKIGDASIVKGVDPEIDQEALRVVKEMPAWIPAKNNGQTVASFFNLPVTFKLSGNNKTDGKNAPSK